VAPATAIEPAGAFSRRISVEASKKLWDRAAWRDAGFFLTYLRPHFNVFIPALIALAITGGMTIVFIKELAAVAGKGLGGATGPEWMAELNRQPVWFLVGIVAAQAFIAFWRILLFAKASERALAALRTDTFSRIIRLPMATLNQRRVGELASRLANDVEAMRETLVVTIPMLIRHTVMLSLCLILILQHVGEALAVHGRHHSGRDRHDRDLRLPASAS
jgi:ATP-binding cassette subfamily B protein